MKANVGKRRQAHASLDPIGADFLRFPPVAGGTRRSFAEAVVSDNRKWRRVPSRLRCWCEGENITVYARIGNLSEGGLFLRTSTPLHEGSRALLRFGNDIEANARVVWARLEGQGGPPGMGLVFEGMDDARLETIRRLILAEGQSGSNNPPSL